VLGAAKKPVRRARGWPQACDRSIATHKEGGGAGACVVASYAICRARRASVVFLDWCGNWCGRLRIPVRTHGVRCTLPYDIFKLVAAVRGRLVVRIHRGQLPHPLPRSPTPSQVEK